MLAERTGAVLKYAQIKDDMSLDVEHMKTLITPKTKLVTMVRERTSERERDNPNPNRVRLRGSVTSLRVFFPASHAFALKLSAAIEKCLFLFRSESYVGVMGDCHVYRYQAVTV